MNQVPSSNHESHDRFRRSHSANSQFEDDRIDTLLQQINAIEFESINETEIEKASIAQLKKAISDELVFHLKQLGYSNNGGEIIIPSNMTKQDLRVLQSFKRKETLLKSKRFIVKRAKKVMEFIANGKDIEPSRIQPKIVEVSSGTLEGDIFRFLTMYWSIPVSQGYGRRMRFLVFDENNNKVIGLFGLTDPVFNLKVRDEWIGWDVNQRRESLRCVMDAFVLGAIPPYSQILGGKLICVLTTSSEVRDAYRDKYGRSKSVIMNRVHDNDLLLLTTTSALGKSSLYDRLRIGNRTYFIPVGPTRGFGHFHISSSLFSKMRVLLRKMGHPYDRGNRFGNGPNWRMRVIRKALQECGFSPNLLKHSIQRDTYVIPLAINSRECLKGKDKYPRFYNENIDSLSKGALMRWVIPRSERRPEFKEISRLELLESIAASMGILNDSRGKRH